MTQRQIFFEISARVHFPPGPSTELSLHVSLVDYSRKKLSESQTLLIILVLGDSQRKIKIFFFFSAYEPLLTCCWQIRHWLCGNFVYRLVVFTLEHFVTEVWLPENLIPPVRRRDVLSPESHLTTSEGSPVRDSCTAEDLLEVFSISNFLDLLICYSAQLCQILIQYPIPSRHWYLVVSH